MNTEIIRKDWIGSVVQERYRLLQWLGSFGQSGIYLCDIDGNEERKAAIKLFPADVEGSAACAAGWTTAAGLSHPHLVGVLDTGRSQVENTGVLYVVTEYAGEVLSEILTERALTPEEVKEMLGPVLDALAYLHDNGLVHGRVKPSNIMVVDDQLKISSENIRGSAAAFAPPTVLEIYDAPEKTQGRISPATDMWSLGVTLVEALTRIPPAWNRTGHIDPPLPPSVPAPFAQIARECLRLDPAHRCTLSEVWACLDSGATIPHRPIKPKTNPLVVGGPIIARRNIALGVVALIGVFAIVSIIARHRSSAPAPVASDETTSAPSQDQTPAQPEPTAPQESPMPQTQAPVQQAPPAQDSTPGPTAESKPAAPVAIAPPEQAPAKVQTSPPAPAEVAPTAQATGGPSAKGAVAQQVMPDVPEKAIRTIQGKVKVSIQVNVNANGSVGDASIASQGPSKYFANLALEAARSWKFNPPQTNGQGVASVWLLHFDFRQSGVDVTPTEQSP